MDGRFTDEELAIAKSVDLCAVAESLGYTVKRIMSYVDIFADYESNKLALGMLADAPLETFLREHPQITSIRFCLDGDEPGRKAAAELMRKYYELGYEVEDCPPPAGYKDYNEWLVATKLNLNRMNKRADEPVRA